MGMDIDYIIAKLEEARKRDAEEQNAPRDYEAEMLKLQEETGQSNFKEELSKDEIPPVSVRYMKGITNDLTKAESDAMKVKKYDEMVKAAELNRAAILGAKEQEMRTAPVMNEMYNRLKTAIAQRNALASYINPNSLAMG